MNKTIIHSQNAPAAIGPYSQAVGTQSLLFLSGMIALDAQSGELCGADAAAQTRKIMENLTALLADAGASLDRVVKTTVFLCDLNDFAAVNEVYGQAFALEPPARSCVEVSRLPKGALVEIECIALR